MKTSLRSISIIGVLFITFFTFVLPSWAEEVKPALPTSESAEGPVDLTEKGGGLGLGNVAEDFVNTAIQAATGADAADALSDSCGYFFRSGKWTLSNLDYMGIPFSRSANGGETRTECVNAKTDALATEKCAAFAGTMPDIRIINPANPQYFSRSQEDRLRATAESGGFSGELTRDSNPYGFYFCVPGSGSGAPRGKR